jgi:hypothetical protein
MNDLKKMLEERRFKKSTLIATTVRLSEGNSAFIDELAEYLGKSKQETLVTLIEHGIKEARALIDDGIGNQVQEPTGYYVLNTNKKNHADDGKWMIAHGAAAAFYSPWKDLIDRLTEKDIVFLYENGVGIVAWGRASGKTEKRDYNGEVGEKHFQKLHEFTTLDKPLAAREIRRLLNYDLPFLRTMTAVQGGQILVDAIKKMGVSG